MDKLEAAFFTEEDDELNNDESIQLRSMEKVELDDSGQCRLAMNVPNEFFGGIIGLCGELREHIERVTQCQLDFGKPTENHITIQSSSENNVLRAYRRVAQIVVYNRNKKFFNHFLSFPLSQHDEFRSKFVEFKNKILGDPEMTPEGSNITEAVFQSEQRLHFTIRIFHLANDFEKQEMKDLLIKFKQNFLDDYLKQNGLDKSVGGKPLMLRVRGLDYFNDDPEQVNVLYAKTVQEGWKEGESNHLTAIVNGLYDWFTPSLYSIKDREQVDKQCRVRLHCTLLNTTYLPKNQQTRRGRGYRGGRGGGGGHNRFERVKLNVSPIMAKYGDYDFGVVPLDRIDLSIVGRFEEKGFYESAARIEF